MQKFESDFFINEWRIQPRLNRLSIGNNVFHVEPKIMQVLVYLAERAGEVITREELMKAIWTDTVIHEDVLSRSVSELRKIFGDSPRDPHYIETIHKAGYRLIASVSMPTVEKQNSGVKYVLGAGIFIILLTVGFFWLMPLNNDFKGDMPLEARPITSYAGREIDPAFSPDGNQVVFSREKGTGQFNLYIKEVEGDHSMQLTDNQAMDISPAWSPDGLMIAFVRITGDTCTIRIIAPTGGTNRKLCDCNEWDVVQPQWMPDSRHLIYSDRVSVQEPYRIISFSVDSLKKEYLGNEVESGIGDMYPAISFDGTRLAFIRRDENKEYIIMSMILKNGEVKPLTRETFKKILDLEWMPDGRSLVFTGFRNERWGLWKIPVQGGKITWLPTGTDEIIDLTVNHPQKTFAYEKRSSVDNIWRISFTDSDILPVQLIVSTRWDSKPRYSPEEKKIAYQSTRSGHHEIWMADPDGTNQVQLTYLRNYGTRDPVWSPDGKYVGFSTSVGESTDLYSVGLDFGVPEQLTYHPSDERDMQWSWNGQEIYYRSNRKGGWDIWKQKVGTSKAIRITQSGDISFFKVYDQYVYYTRANNSGLWKLSVDGGEPEKILRELNQQASRNWTVTGSGVYFARQNTFSQSVLSYYKFSTEIIKDITRLENLSIFSGLGLSPDESKLLYSRTDYNESDIILVKNFE